MNDERRWHLWLLGPIALLLLTMLVTSQAKAADPVAGSQGTDTALPATASQLTVNGRDAFSNLAITVNQTANLTDQAVSITWTGGTPTVQGPGRFGSQYLQIMQCWGDDDGTVPGNPGPPPEQCEQGAVAGTPEGLPGSLYPNQIALSRTISRSPWANFDPAVGYLDQRTTEVWLPFRAVDGTVVNIPTDPTFNPAIVGGNFWLNPYFNQITTNEIAGAATGPDGEGAELFQVATGVESSGLGCGQRSQPVPGSDNKIPKCWIVVVPRGNPVDENAGTPFAQDAVQYGVVTSPVSPAAWKHRIAIRIDFNPVDSSCAFGADERRIAGSELALPAVASWQPALCGSGSSSPYSYVPVSDSSARQQVVSGQPGTPGLVVVSKPLVAGSFDSNKPVVYAPISASGLVIGFNIERNPLPDAPSAEKQLAGIRIADLNLTPRLVAKLLTQSYGQAVSIQQTPNYPWMSANPANMRLDPDFLRFNPEFGLLQIDDSRTFSSLQLPAGNSDSAQQVWAWILADPEARAWMDGTPDDWGMKVNPIYATTDAANSTGAAFGSPLPSSFPKADPYCYKAPARGTNNTILPPPLCGTDWVPYRRSLADSAQVTRSASDGARVLENPSAISASGVWSRVPPQFLGRRDMLAITDSPSAALFGVQTARLSRAGDNGGDRTFIAADTNGLIEGVAVMSPGAEPTVLEPSPTTVAPAAYPLTTLTYAAISPLSLDAVARSEYSAFIEYAAGPGQVPGIEFGQLPRGYVPLPAVLQAQAASTASLVRTMVAPDTVDPSATTTTSTESTASTVSEATLTTPATSVIAETPSPPAAIGNAPTAAFAVTTPPMPRAPTTVPTSMTSVPSIVDVQAPVTSAADTSATRPPTVSTTASAADLADQPVSSSPSIITPVVQLAKSRYAVPGLGVVAISSALFALEITKRPRRRLSDGGDEFAVEEIGPS